MKNVKFTHVTADQDERDGLQQEARRPFERPSLEQRGQLEAITLERTFSFS